MTTKPKNAKPIFKTSSPFTETQWPLIAHEDQQVILELTCNLLAPIGDHRRSHTSSLKGNKRKRNDKNGTPEESSAPPQPEISSHALVGINSITRHLESVAAKIAPTTVPAGKNASTSLAGWETPTPNGKPARQLSLIVIPHHSPSSSPAHAHLPTLLHLSTLSSNSPIFTTRLITLPTTADARLANALRIPRVGALAIFEGAPGAKGLEDFVREKVGLTECKWVDEAMGATWKGVNVHRG